MSTLEPANSENNVIPAKPEDPRVIGHRKNGHEILSKSVHKKEYKENIQLSEAATEWAKGLKNRLTCKKDLARYLGVSVEDVGAWLEGCKLPHWYLVDPICTHLGLGKTSTFPATIKARETFFGLYEKACTLLTPEQRAYAFSSSPFTEPKKHVKKRVEPESIYRHYDLPEARRDLERLLVRTDVFGEYVAGCLKLKGESPSTAETKSHLSFTRWATQQTTANGHKHLPEFSSLGRIANYLNLANADYFASSKFCYRSRDFPENQLQKLVRLHITNYLDRLKDETWNKDMLPSSFGRHMMSYAETLNGFVRGFLLAADINLHGRDVLQELNSEDTTPEKRAQNAAAFLCEYNRQHPKRGFNEDRLTMLVERFTRHGGEKERDWHHDIARMRPSPNDIQAALEEMGFSKASIITRKVHANGANGHITAGTNGYSGNGTNGHEKKKRKKDNGLIDNEIDAIVEAGAPEQGSNMGFVYASYLKMLRDKEHGEGIS